MPEKSKGGIDAQLKRIGELCAERKGDDYESMLNRLTEARELFHGMLAQRLTEPFNAHLAQQPQATLPEKQALTRNANADLRSLGLAIRCPRTSEAAVLHADGGHKLTDGRFQIGLIGSGRDRKRTVSSRELFAVELMSHPVRREGFAQYWAERIANNRGDPKKRGSD